MRLAPGWQHESRRCGARLTRPRSSTHRSPPAAPGPPPAAPPGPSAAVGTPPGSPAAQALHYHQGDRMEEAAVLSLDQASRAGAAWQGKSAIQRYAACLCGSRLTNNWHTLPKQGHNSLHSPTRAALNVGTGGIVSKAIIKEAPPRCCAKPPGPVPPARTPGSSRRWRAQVRRGTPRAAAARCSR